MGFERIAEQKIREAIRDGKFDGLARPGERIDLEAYFKTPAELRLAYSVLKSAGCLPEEVELLNEIGAIERSLAEVTDAAARQRLQQSLAAARLRLSLALERMGR